MTTLDELMKQLPEIRRLHAERSKAARILSGFASADDEKDTLLAIIDAQAAEITTLLKACATAGEAIKSLTAELASVTSERNAWACTECKNPFSADRLPYGGNPEICENCVESVIYVQPEPPAPAPAASGGHQCATCGVRWTIEIEGPVCPRCEWKPGTPVNTASDWYVAPGTPLVLELTNGRKRPMKPAPARAADDASEAAPKLKLTKHRHEILARIKSYNDNGKVVGEFHLTSSELKAARELKAAGYIERGKYANQVGLIITDAGRAALKASER